MLALPDKDRLGVSSCRTCGVQSSRRPHILEDAGRKTLSSPHGDETNHERAFVCWVYNMLAARAEDACPLAGGVSILYATSECARAGARARLSPQYARDELSRSPDTERACLLRAWCVIHPFTLLHCIATVVLIRRLILCRLLVTIRERAAVVLAISIASTCVDRCSVISRLRDCSVCGSVYVISCLMLPFRFLILSLFRTAAIVTLY
jgi:hypothetical protein